MRRRHRRKFLLLFLIFAVAAFMLLLYMRARMSPITEELAFARVNNVVSRIINNAIDEQIASGTINYDRMIYLEKDVDGNITALKTNMAEINNLKTQILSILNERLYDISVEDLGIAIGSLIAPEFFAGRGPKIPVRIISCSMTSAGFENVFSAAGINQTLHQILMDVTVTVSLLLPTGSATVDVQSQVVIAETVIVGTVPDNYVNFSETQSASDAANKYFNFVG